MNIISNCYFGLQFTNNTGKFLVPIYIYVLYLLVKQLIRPLLTYTKNTYSKLSYTDKH